MKEKNNKITCRIIEMGEPTRLNAHVVAIDVIRAFTTAALALELGAKSIMCVGSLADARQMKLTQPELLLMGEDAGQKPIDFDVGNSPHELRLNGKAILKNRDVIQCTSNGTRGLLSSNSSVRWAAAAVNASETVNQIIASGARDVDLMITDSRTGEDRACAEFMRDSLEGLRPDPQLLREKILAAEAHICAHWHRTRSDKEIEAFHQDVLLAAAVDSLPLAMRGVSVAKSVRIER